jgi:hypothetical protein
MCRHHVQQWLATSQQHLCTTSSNPRNTFDLRADVRDGHRRTWHKVDQPANARDVCADVQDGHHVHLPHAQQQHGEMVAYSGATHGHSQSMPMASCSTSSHPQQQQQPMYAASSGYGAGDTRPMAIHFHNAIHTNATANADAETHVTQLARLRNTVVTKVRQAVSNPVVAAALGVAAAILLKDHVPGVRGALCTRQSVPRHDLPCTVLSSLDFFPGSGFVCEL